MSEERCNYLDSLLAAIHLLHLDLLGVVKDAVHLNGFKTPILFELGQVLGTGPVEVGLVEGSDVNWPLLEVRGPARHLVVLIVLVSVLVFRCLVDENCQDHTFKAYLKRVQ